MYHVLGKSSTSLESMFFSSSIEHSRNVIGKIVVELQLYKWELFENCDVLKIEENIFYKI